MAKKQEAPCMFCGGLPCTCDGGQTKKSSKRIVKASSPAEKKTTKKSQDSTPPSKESDERIFGEIPKPAKPKFKLESHSEDKVDLSTLSVLRILRPLLHVRDQKRIDQVLNKPYPQDLDRRVAEWKARHESE